MSQVGYGPGGIYELRKVGRGGGWIAKANAVLHELYRLVVPKREVSNTAKLSVFKSAFVPILTNDPESSEDRNSIISGASDDDGIFVKSQWCDTS